MVDSMTELKTITPLKLGLLIVALAYFLFTLHALFTLEWVGEWDRIASGSMRFIIFTEDVSAFVGIIFRFIAGIIAFGSVVYYFSKGLPSNQKVYRILRGVLVFEALYWLTLLPTACAEIYLVATRVGALSTSALLSYLAWTTIPAVVESIIPPAVLLVLALKLNVNKPQNSTIKWALISGTSYIAVFWLLNMGSWMTAIMAKGTSYLTSNPQHILSYTLTVFGLLFLALYSGYFTWKSRRIQTLEELNLRAVGAIITLLGLYFLWNYLSWAYFGENLWSTWYAWFLGHNLDLWMLSLPLVGVPIMFFRASNSKAT
jgi:hypothetical protein